MSEYAYDFTGDNVHYGPSRNPHDLDRMSGGSSADPSSAVAMGLVSMSARIGYQRLNSRAVIALRHRRAKADLRPAISRRYIFPRAELRSCRPMARTVRDIALAYDAMQGADPRDPVAPGGH